MHVAGARRLHAPHGERLLQPHPEHERAGAPSAERQDGARRRAVEHQGVVPAAARRHHATMYVDSRDERGARWRSGRSVGGGVGGWGFGGKRSPPRGRRRGGGFFKFASCFFPFRKFCIRLAIGDYYNHLYSAGCRRLATVSVRK